MGARGARTAALFVIAAAVTVSAVRATQVAVDMRALILSTKAANAPELHAISTLLGMCGCFLPIDCARPASPARRSAAASTNLSTTCAAVHC